MQNIVLLLICLMLGIGLRASGRVPENAHTTLNAFIINIAFPALVLTQVHGIRAAHSLLYAVAMPWLAFAIGAGLFWTIGRALRLPPASIGALMLTGGLGNTSFMGLPMIEAFSGKAGIGTGILIDTLGTYLVLSTLGITIACIYARGEASAGTVIRRVLTFPPLIAVVVALILNPIVYPRLAEDVLGRLGATLAPLALVSVGMQLRSSALRGNSGALAAGLGYKLVAAPAAIFLLYAVVLGLRGDNLRVTLLESAMGPQIGAAIVATQYGLAPELVTMMVGVGTLMAFVTLPVWWSVISAFA
ncbi:MAG: AEC family transporter [Rhodospirillales bacterium]|nr:AEC family transporter [Rhodospirillales bacterium]